MDGFLTPATNARHEAAGPNMADSPTGTTPESGETTLADISAEIRALAANMVTKDDLRGLSETLYAAIHTEVTALRADLVAQDSRLQHLENTTQAHTAEAEASNLAITRQGNMLLTLRRHTEDLDNRGRRSNIRVRGIPESAGEEDVEALLRALFRGILGAETPATIEFDRAHRANRLRTMEGTPRDVICCMHQYKLKEKIMAKARSRPTWRFQDADVALYQDLSPLTLEARRALRPITTQLQERRINYKWGYPFALLARQQNEWIPLRWPEEAPRFLQRLGLPPTEITNWILNQPEQRPGPQTPHKYTLALTHLPNSSARTRH
ncbi:Hypothetical predicted protein [Pelobates cultripes]|uniref:Uncharacterized protein n=1 Tax=Pelobates cultripes TaxID=61616 RepID=A0AAD1WQS7_PELCU|nr:Hypothetical predicted protein [Pelobates cultripes]